MAKKTIYQQIRDTVDAHLPGTRILLYGSRARGDHRPKSDYDLMIITPAHFSFKEKINWESKLHRLLVHALNASVDVLMNSEEEISIKRELPGHIVRSAVREGIAI